MIQDVLDFLIPQYDIFSSAYNLENDNCELIENTNLNINTSLYVELGAEDEKIKER